MRLYQPAILLLIQIISAGSVSGQYINRVSIQTYVNCGIGGIQGSAVDEVSGTAIHKRVKGSAGSTLDLTYRLNKDPYNASPFVSISCHYLSGGQRYLPEGSHTEINKTLNYIGLTSGVGFRGFNCDAGHGLRLHAFAGPCFFYGGSDNHPDAQAQQTAEYSQRALPLRDRYRRISALAGASLVYSVSKPHHLFYSLGLVYYQTFLPLENPNATLIRQYSDKTERVAYYHAAHGHQYMYTIGIQLALNPFWSGCSVTPPASPATKSEKKGVRIIIE